MNRLQVQLVIRLDQHKAHVFALDGIGNASESTKSFVWDR
jgi:hypothetical protein